MKIKAKLMNKIPYSDAHNIPNSESTLKVADNEVGCNTGPPEP